MWIHERQWAQGVLVGFLYRVFVVFFAAATCGCTAVQADGSAGKGDQKSSNGVAGEWRVVRTYPDRPGSQGSHTESFQLVCKGRSSEELKFQIGVLADGDVYVSTTKELTQSGQTEAYAYVNAIRWKDGEDIYLVDRFSGALTVDPGKRSYQCEKVGGRKF